MISSYICTQCGYSYQFAFGVECLYIVPVLKIKVVLLSNLLISI